MKIGIMTVNGFDFHPNKRFREEAEAMGHEIMLINPYEMGCFIEEGTPSVFFSDAHTLPDLVMPRQGSPMGEYGFVLLNQLASLGIPLVNGIKGVTTARNQFLTLQALNRAGLSVPPSCFVIHKALFFRGIETLGGYPVVVKEVDGMGGDGVIKISNQSEAEALVDTLAFFPKGILIQSFIAPEGRQDIRVLVVGNGVAGAMSLTPAAGGFKANIHQQGEASFFEPSDELKDMALRSARACCLEVAGVDMAVDDQGRPLIFEVNYSPGFRGLEGASGINIARRILEHALDTL